MRPGRGVNPGLDNAHDGKSSSVWPLSCAPSVNPATLRIGDLI